MDIATCVKDVLSEVMCIAKKAEFFISVCGDDDDDDDDLAANKWIPCRSEEPGARRTMQEPAMGGIAFQIIAPAAPRMDVQDVIARHRPSVSMEDLEQYERFSEEFGKQAKRQHCLLSEF